jgi:hypothetical protein
MANNAYNLGARDPLKDKGSWAKSFKRRAGIAKATDRLTKEEVELDESITRMSDGRLKFHATKKVPHGSFSNAEIEDEHDRRNRTSPEYRKAKPSLSEEAEQLDELSPNLLHRYIKKATPDVAARAISAVAPNQSAQTKKHASKLGKRIAGITSASGRLADKANASMYEDSDLTENFKQGTVSLKDGSSVLVKKQDADLLNQMFKDLNATNRKRMMDVAMTDRDGFNEILGFAREAL